MCFCKISARVVVTLARSCTQNRPPISLVLSGLTDVLWGQSPPSKSPRRSLPLSLTSKTFFSRLSLPSKRKVWWRCDRTRKEPATAQRHSDEGASGNLRASEQRAGKHGERSETPASVNWPRTTAKRAEPAGTRCLAPPGTKREAMPNGRRATLGRRPASRLTAKPKKNDKKNANRNDLLRFTLGGWAGLKRTSIVRCLGFVEMLFIVGLLGCLLCRLL